MVDIQDKEVTMEGIFSVAATDQWTPLSVSGQPPKPRYKVFTCTIYLLVTFWFCAGLFSIVGSHILAAIMFCSMELL
jgi:hypothetical protein